MNIPYVFKKCSKCGEWLVAYTGNFMKRKDAKDGLRAICKNCYHEWRKKHYKENKSKYKKYSKKYRSTHDDELKKYREGRREFYLNYCKMYYAENKSKYEQYQKQYQKQYYKENKELITKRHNAYSGTPQGQIARLNSNSKRRINLIRQGSGVTKEQWLEMMKFFNWRCAYSGVPLCDNNRSIDHVVPLNDNGEHEVWNCVPMDRYFNCSKQDKRIIEWYKQQEFYSDERLQKIYEWQQYAKEKWKKKEVV